MLQFWRVCAQARRVCRRWREFEANQAIAAALCVGVVDAFHSGIGGGGISLVKYAGQEPTVFDYRETAPAAAHKNMFDGMSPIASRWGGLAAAVPGEIRGYEELHKEYGRVPWSLLFEPAATVARRGFRMPLQVYLANAYIGPVLCTLARLNETYCHGAELKQPGDFVVLPELATTLENIGKYGPDAFYSGDIAQGIVDAVKADGGIITLDDLASYSVVRRGALSVDLGSRRVWSVPAPGSGASVLSVLRTMSHYPDAPYKRSDTLTTHRLIEATKFAYGARTEFGDPSFITNTSALERDAISAEAAEARFKRINDSHVHNSSTYIPSNSSLVCDAGTSHISATDKSGLSISMTTTVNLFYGNLLVTDGGIILNNEMDDFSRPDTPNAFNYEPAAANFIEAGKRPMSSMSPVIVEDIPSGDATLVIGASGGSRIISSTVINTYSYLCSGGKESLSEIIAAPRWHDQLLPEITYLETTTPWLPEFGGYDRESFSALQQRGHNSTWIEPGWSNAQGIERRPDGRYFAATEPRQVNSRGAAI